MKMSLGYQSTEYDCVPSTIINGIRYLFDRYDIPPEIIKIVNLYSLDTKDKNGKNGGRGTSNLAIQVICNCLNEFPKFNINCELLKSKEVSIDKISECIEDNGVVAVRVYYGYVLYHYVLITDIDKENIYVFDPYYRKQSFKDNEIQIEDKKPCEYNRKVSKERFLSKELKIFAMGKFEERECILMSKY